MTSPWIAAALFALSICLPAAPALALGCTAQSPGLSNGLGIGTVQGVPATGTGKLALANPTGDCAVGHYQALQQKRAGSALFAQPIDPNTTTATPTQQ